MEISEYEADRTSARLAALTRGDAERAARVAAYDAAYFRERPAGYEHCGEFSEPDGFGGRRVAHAPDCACAEPWGDLALRVRSAAALSRTRAAELARYLHPRLAAAGLSEDAAVSLVRDGRISLLRNLVGAPL